MSKETEVRNAIRKIAGTDRTNDTFFTAKVISVDNETCTVEHDGLKLTDVQLNASVDGNVNNILIKPKVDSMVLIADMGDSKRDCVIIAWSEIDSISMGGGTTITINEGTNGGLVISSKMAAWMNKAYSDFQALKTALATWVTPAAGSPFGLQFAPTTPNANAVDFENAKIKH